MPGEAEVAIQRLQCRRRLGLHQLGEPTEVWQAESRKKFDINLVSMVHLKNGADEVPRGDAPKQDDMQPVLLSTSCSRSITSKSVTPTVWSASWT